MIQEITFGKIHIGETHPVVIIAEAAVEHLGSLQVAKRMADAAKEAGADIIKFQMHMQEEMIPHSIRFFGGDMDDVLNIYNLSTEDHRELIQYCKQIGIQYLCTPFCAAAADALDQIGAEAYKTGSGELTNIPMQRHIAQKGKPMIVSTGMATIEEIQETVAALREENATFMLTHCTSAYPPQYEQIHLRFIPKLKERFGVLVGHSDHTPDIYTAIAAVAIGARVIEKHFTLSRTLKGPDHHVSLEPHELKQMVEAIRKVEAALGDKKLIHEDELPVRSWAHHSVVSVQNIPADTLIQPQMVAVKRPGGGIPAKFLEQVYGRRTKRELPKHTLLRWEDIE